MMIVLAAVMAVVISVVAIWVLEQLYEVYFVVKSWFNK